MLSVLNIYVNKPSTAQVESCVFIYFVCNLSALTKFVSKLTCGLCFNDFVSVTFIPERPGKNVVRRLNNTKIGTWDVRTPLDTGKLCLLAKELERLKCNICGIAETRWATAFYASVVAPQFEEIF